MHNKISDAESFFETASKEELIDYLVKTIEKEVSKGDDADCDLVRECSDWLDELTEDEVTFTPEELERKLAQLKAGSESKKPVKICKKAKLKTFVRVALIAAVIFAISLVSLSAVAMNKGYGSAWEYISSNVEKIFGLNQGEAINGDGITVIKNSETVRYSNVNEFLKAESLNILYPSVLPEDNLISEIHIVEKTDNQFMIYFIFSKDTNSLNITNYYSSNPAELKGVECITINNFNYYVKRISEDIYYAILQYNGIEYIIQSNSYDDLLIILNNMKGMTP